MDREQMRVGEKYVVAGEGVMLLARNGEKACEFEVHGGGRCWVGRDRVLRSASWRDVDAYQEQARPRGVGCDDPDCWCRRRT